MSLEVLVLALANALRPGTSCAVVPVLLAAANPRRLLLAFVAAGITACAAIGIAVVAGLHGVDVALGGSATDAGVDLLAGVAALGFAAGVWSGAVRRPSGRDRRPSGEPSWVVRRLKAPSLRLAAAAGVVTHLPGLLYLVALNAIAAGDPAPADAVFQVLVYDALWFSVPIAALLLVGRRPDATRDALARAQRWGRRHERAILASLFAGVGAYLSVRGAIGLLG